MRSRSGLGLLGLLTAAGMLPLAAGGTAAAAGSPGHAVFQGTHSALTKAQVERLAGQATHRSVIIFKNQLSALPAKGITAGPRSGRPAPPRRASWPS